MIRGIFEYANGRKFELAIERAVPEFYVPYFIQNSAAPIRPYTGADVGTYVFRLVARCPNNRIAIYMQTETLTLARAPSSSVDTLGVTAGPYHRAAVAGNTARDAGGGVE